MSEVTEPKQTKKIKVKLTGTDGNAFALLGRCLVAARKGKMDPETIKAFRAEATKGNYDHLLCTCCDYFDVR